MTQEEKDLLLRDICSRMPYGVKFKHEDKHTLCEILSITPIYDYENVIYFNDYINHPKKCNIDDVKPYLFPLSSMTKEQKIIYGDLCYAIIHSLAWDTQAALNELNDWLNKNHFDHNNLIPKGLANDATNLNVY